MQTLIQNDRLRLRVDSHGAQMMELTGADGTEYLWQGDPKYWPDRAPLLFPYIARLTEGACLVHGRRFHMPIHGFASGAEFSLTAAEPERLELTLHSTPETRAQYPFDFTLEVGFRLRGDTVEISYRVVNHSDTVMPFGIGGHPGFRVPLTAGERFEDYALTFSQCCSPDQVGFTPELFLSGQDTPYPLQEGRRLPLRHELFCEDAIILKHMAREVTLRSSVTGRGVRLTYPDMPYLGIWHQPNTDAPYVCVEPWSSLPSRQGIVEELTCKSDLIQLAPGGVWETAWSITVLDGTKSVE